MLDLPALVAVLALSDNDHDDFEERYENGEFDRYM